ncbi:hypothetical protein AD929_15630 [Gluconobacter potus]|uniref:Endonuclease n=1 Tax=Gluconobacter potus TaxID=2724927 RepID=A0A149QPK3_9PROT|nr:DNA/RNA non-specific endonuclease [Gluconobacter potus]KXU99228.1 hypothetical protein AD929_15630 [Gluconobacter potus]
MRFLIAVLLACTSPAVAANCPDFSPGGQLPTQSNAGPVLCSQFYAAQQSLNDREPLWSAEHLTEEGVEQAQAMTGRAPFYPDTRLPAGQRAELDDYRRSGWSRGHLTPSGDTPDRASRIQTFALSNIVPQNARMNSGPWDKIERAVRNLATQDGELYVVTGPAFKEDLGTIGSDHIQVPSSIWKAIYDPADGAVAVVVCKNQATPSCGQVPFDVLVRVVGIDPFPGVSAKEKSKRVTVKGWPD